MLRTHTCGELRNKDIDKKVKLCGWVDTIRQFGKVTFLVLRDRYGKTQIILKEKSNLKQEYCIQVSGKVVKRKDLNKNMPTGDIEIIAETIKVFNKCPNLPFGLKDSNVDEDLRLKYRYLDLRTERMISNLTLRSKLINAIHDYMEKDGFIHVETPILAKTTPEGARDYIVPSRVNAGKFFALPQSPQIFKQLMMIANYDKYYQIARCFRDEDLRADRQPEFTQLDVEMSFAEPDDIFTAMEEMFKYIFKKVLNIEIKTPFPRVTYEISIKKFGHDKPDLRKNKKDNSEFAFVWVVDYPLFEWSEEKKKLVSSHHPFTGSEKGADFSKPEKIKSKAYDCVLNGVELASGSIRIHDKETQAKVFKTLGILEKEAQQKFGFLLNALSYGAPPHGGIAFGLDRVFQILAKASSIREVIAFPKNQEAKDLMMDSPSYAGTEQLKDVHVNLDLPKEKGRKKK
ncbi:MAG: aspartate--tRNA ligase [Nanoarchaeota archaeon]|nr:aspartate--tRNA ligase [Nanoarchaeota archaeon]MBU1051506.1 aspartate--tRNA ligase [Nanoarchaeota archaeon]MBU1988572.1 aspartate--tRNA ligase [Nanoarchaeota archaeon]